jgi:hypothetical protein
VSVDVAVDRVKELAKRPVKFSSMIKLCCCKGKTKVTRSVIAPELSVKNARRLVELMARPGSVMKVFSLLKVWPWQKHGNYRRAQSHC